VCMRLADISIVAKERTFLLWFDIKLD